MPQTLRAPIAGRAAPPGVKVVIPAKKIAHADRIPQSDLRFARDLIRKRKVALSIRRSTMDDLPTILHLIDEAKGWLKSKDTDQWSTDWLDKDGRSRSDRVECSLKEEKTWLACFSFRGSPEIPVATVTIERTVNTDIWTQPEKIAERAVYLSRLVTARNFSGLQIGDALIDWACDHAAREYAADWIRIDVWTHNRALHRYYRQRGFAWCGLCPDRNYPSRARFQRPTSMRTKDKPLLIERSSTLRQPNKSRASVHGHRLTSVYR